MDVFFKSRVNGQRTKLVTKPQKHPIFWIYKFSLKLVSTATTQVINHVGIGSNLNHQPQHGQVDRVHRMMHEADPLVELLR